MTGMGEDGTNEDDTSDVTDVELLLDGNAFNDGDAGDALDGEPAEDDGVGDTSHAVDGCNDGHGVNNVVGTRVGDGV